VLADWLEDRSDAAADARADAVRRVLRWREAVRDARAEEVPDDGRRWTGVASRSPGPGVV
jgi:hypothetical protein